MNIEVVDIDRRIWQDELDEFVPRRIFDVHTHAYRWAFNTDPAKDTGPYYSVFGGPFPEVDWLALETCDRLLMPGREVHRLTFPVPFAPACDFTASNDFVSEQVRGDPTSAALMLVEPSMSAEFLEAQIHQNGFIGLKPYRVYSITGDSVNCRITDFLPRHQIEVANRHGLLIMMHLSKRDAIADPENQRDLLELSAEFPTARWILAHCARSYSAWAIERAASSLKGLANVWYDTSSVCESDAIEALISAVGVDRVMYGSDDIPVGVTRGKYITFGFAWAYVTEQNHSLNLSHCDPQMTFTRYEQLRAMRRASMRLGLSLEQINRMFWGTAFDLVEQAKRPSSNLLPLKSVTGIGRPHVAWASSQVPAGDAM